MPHPEPAKLTAVGACRLVLIQRCTSLLQTRYFLPNGGPGQPDATRHRIESPLASQDHARDETRDPENDDQSQGKRKAVRVLGGRHDIAAAVGGEDAARREEPPEIEEAEPRGGEREVLLDVLHPLTKEDVSSWYRRRGAKRTEPQAPV